MIITELLISETCLGCISIHQKSDEAMLFLDCSDPSYKEQHSAISQPSRFTHTIINGVNSPVITMQHGSADTVATGNAIFRVL